MNTVSTISNYIIELLEQDVLNHTISFEKTSEIDLNKENIYPLTNIDILNSNVTDQIITINYKITTLEQRDILPTQTSDKLYNSNLIDNLNETHAIASRLIMGLKRPNDLDIFIAGLSDITFLKQHRANELDGCQFTITLGIDNNITGC